MSKPPEVLDMSFDDMRKELAAVPGPGRHRRAQLEGALDTMERYGHRARSRPRRDRLLLCRICRGIISAQTDATVSDERGTAHARCMKKDRGW